MPHTDSILTAPNQTSRHAILALLIGAALVPSPSRAGDGIWINSGSNSTWGTASNWSASTPGQGVDAMADFSTLDVTATRTVNLGANWTVGGLRFGDLTPTNNWAIANGTGGPWTLTLETSSGAPTIEVVNQTATISASLGGSHGFQKIGAGTLTLATSNSFTGGVLLNQGALAFTNGSLGLNPVTFTGTSSLTWSGAHTQDVSSQLVVNDGVVATINIGTNNVTFASAIQSGGTGTGAITKAGAGTLTITAAQTLTGTTRVNAGRIVLAGGDNRLSASPVVIGQGTGGGVLQLGDATAPSNQTVSGLTISGTATTNAVVGGNASASNLTVTPTVASIFNGTLGGSGTNENNLALTKTGAPTLTLGGTNSFTGNVTVGGGALILTNSAALGTGSKTVTINGVTNAPSLQLNNAAGLTLSADYSFVTSNDNAGAPAILNTAGANTIAGNIALTSGGFGTGQTRVSASGGNLTLTGNITPDASAAAARTFIVDGAATGAVSGTLADNAGITLGLTKVGVGTWTLTGANTYTGTTSLSAGRLVIDEILPNGTPQPLGTAATALILGSVTAATLEYAGTTDATLSRPVNSGGTGGGVIQNSSGALLTLAGTLTKNSRPLTLSGGDFRVTGRVTGTGTTTSELFINGATATLANSNNNYSGPTVVTGGGTLVLAGSISGTVSVSLTGGTLVLTGSDLINNAADIELGGGTFNTGGFSEGTTNAPGLGRLVLEADTMLDFGSGSGSLLSFSGFGFTAGKLAISNWSGTPNSIGSSSDDRLIFAGSSDAFSTAFAQTDVSFNGVPGYSAIAFGTDRFEIVAVPEPSSTALAGAAALLGLVGYRERRRFTATSLSPRPTARRAVKA